MWTSLQHRGLKGPGCWRRRRRTPGGSACFHLTSFSATSVCVYTCACARNCTARKGHRASHRVLSVLRELLPHPQSCCLRLFKKNLTQWWVEPERRAAVGWGQGAAVPFALLIPQSFPAVAWCPCPLSRDAARWGRRWPPLQRGRRGGREAPRAPGRPDHSALGWTQDSSP